VETRGNREENFPHRTTQAASSGNIRRHPLLDGLSTFVFGLWQLTTSFQTQVSGNPWANLFAAGV
jgi:hypothetical protein